MSQRKKHLGKKRWLLAKKLQGNQTLGQQAYQTKPQQVFIQKKILQNNQLTSFFYQSAYDGKTILLSHD